MERRLNLRGATIIPVDQPLDFGLDVEQLQAVVECQQHDLDIFLVPDRAVNKLSDQMNCIKQVLLAGLSII
jgi:hypothetical protein